MNGVWFIINQEYPDYKVHFNTGYEGGNTVLFASP